MEKLVVHGATLNCNEGSAPSQLVAGGSTGEINGKPVASINDHQGSQNIPPFGLCRTTKNPEVAAATAAAKGTLTPAPCVPAIDAPWQISEPRVYLKDNTALTSACRCCCRWGGTITIADPSSEVEVS